MGRPNLMGGVAVKKGLTAPDEAMRMGGAMAADVRQQEVVVHRDSEEGRRPK